jgi:hypothetical protein
VEAQDGNAPAVDDLGSSSTKLSYRGSTSPNPPMLMKAPVVSRTDFFQPAPNPGVSSA